jgi:hypothetical protein
MPDYKAGPKIDFAVFKNNFAKTDRHPAEVGKIEFTREFLKAMVERAKTGQMPVLRVAMWNRTSKSGVSYRNFRLELEQIKSPQTSEHEEVADNIADKADENEKLPF